ncbi:MAG: thiamine pyrophosphate-requiring protein [Beijerinckiaceae bacterium]
MSDAGGAPRAGVDNFWQAHASDEWSDAIVAAMKLGGVDHLFFVSGTEINFFQEAIAKAQARGTPAPRLVTMVHESVALNAALGSSMISGRPAAAIVHVDVGTFHYGAALHTAWRGGYPVLIMGGTGPRAFPGSMRGARDSLVQWHQEPRDQNGILRDFTKADHRMEHQDNPGLIVSRLLQIAQSEAKGPVYLAIPRETAMLPTGGVSHFPTVGQLGLARPVAPCEEDARAIARWLVKSHNPCVFVERSGRDPQAVAELVALSELLALPVMENAAADRLNFPNSHAHFGTGPQAAQADVLLMLDAVAPFVPGRGSPPAEAKIAWVGPDPVHARYKTMEFRADLWVPANVALTLRAVRAAAESLLDKADLARIADRAERLAQARKAQEARLAEAAAADARLSRPTGRYVAHELGRLIGPDAVLLNDAISNSEHVRAYAGREKPGTYFRSGGSSGGWGSGAAFGAKLAAPDREIVLASGDGYFMFGTPMAALWAASHHKAPYLSVVFVNGSYSTGTTGLKNLYPDGVAVTNGNYNGGVFDPPPDFAKLAEAAGGYGRHVTESADVAPALAEGLAQVRKGSPAVVAVRVPGPLDAAG